MLTFFRSTAAASTAVAVFFLFGLATGVSANDSSLTILEDRLNDLVYRTSRSIVTLESISNSRSGLHSGKHESVHRLISSGVIIDSMGGILVAASSVVGRDHLLVRFADQVISVQLIGIDYHTGLALVSAGIPLGRPARLAHQYGCAGQMVVAIGNAYGVRASPSLGFCAGMRPEGSIQFSAQITSGTVGGGLFDLSGWLVGVITGGIGRDRWAEVGLAVPSPGLAKVARYLYRHGDRQAGYVGITSVDIEITPGIEVTMPAQLVRAESQRYFIVDRAVMITDVIPLSPAANAGLACNDLLVSLNGEAITSAVALRSFVRQSHPGSVIDIGLVRNNLPLVVPLQIGRLRLSPFDSFHGVNDEPAQPDNSPEFLRQEISDLKQSLRVLEKKLQGLR
ncbi:MAG: S1C family serine protease [candidate division Zixibacteria bacterium]|nr:S1C family serine protease [candidate division Zixibacteria bacterium]